MDGQALIEFQEFPATKFVLYSTLIAVVLFGLKPSSLFTDNGAIRSTSWFNSNEEATFLPIWAVTPLVGLFFAVLF